MLHAEVRGLLKNGNQIKANAKLEAARDEFCFEVESENDFCFAVAQKNALAVA